MAAHQNARSNNQEHPQQRGDPEDMVLLREKLNQIAVGRQHAGGDNQIEHMDDEEEEDTGVLRRRRTHSGHFRFFLSSGERPSTPPSSPQPRDVLRKQLLMKNHHSLSYQRSACHEDSSSDTASDEPLDGMCVDGVEISPLPFDDTQAPTHTLRPSVRLSVPEHLQSRPSSYSTMSRCPEGFRKRKSVHMDDKELELDGHVGMVPLKRVSSQASVQSGPSVWEYGDQDMEEDTTMDPSSSPANE